MVDYCPQGQGPQVHNCSYLERTSCVSDSPDRVSHRANCWLDRLQRRSSSYFLDWDIAKTALFVSKTLRFVVGFSWETRVCSFANLVAGIRIWCPSSHTICHPFPTTCSSLKLLGCNHHESGDWFYKINYHVGIAGFESWERGLTFTTRNFLFSDGILRQK